MRAIDEQAEQRVVGHMQPLRQPVHPLPPRVPKDGGYAACPQELKGRVFLPAPRQTPQERERHLQALYPASRARSPSGATGWWPCRLRRSPPPASTLYCAGSIPSQFDGIPSNCPCLAALPESRQAVRPSAAGPPRPPNCGHPTVLRPPRPRPGARLAGHAASHGEAPAARGGPALLRLRRPASGGAPPPVPVRAPRPRCRYSGRLEQKRPPAPAMAALIHEGIWAHPRQGWTHGRQLSGLCCSGRLGDSAGCEGSALRLLQYRERGPRAPEESEGSVLVLPQRGLHSPLLPPLITSRCAGFAGIAGTATVPAGQFPRAGCCPAFGGTCGRFAPSATFVGPKALTARSCALPPDARRYDGAGNATTFRGTAHHYNSDNQLTDSGFQFDGNGNGTTCNGGAITYDQENRVTGIGTAITNGYGPDGRRAWKQTSAGRTYYLYDGMVPICEFNSSGNMTAANTFGPTGLLSRSQGTSTFYTFDPIGNTVQKLDSNQNLLSSSIYDATASSASTSTQTDPRGLWRAVGLLSKERSSGRRWRPGRGRRRNRPPGSRRWRPRCGSGGRCWRRERPGSRRCSPGR